MQTYWLALGETNNEAQSSNDGGSSQHSNSDDKGGDADGDAGTDAAMMEKPSQSKTNRLIEWNLDVLIRLIKLIVARRKASGLPEFGTDEDMEHRVLFSEEGATTIDEVAEIIALPTFNAEAATKQENPEQIQLPHAVIDQLYDYVANIAGR